MEEVVKGSDVWFQLDVKRTLTGISLWFKTAPAIEAFVKGLATGVIKYDSINEYAGKWHSGTEKPLQVYKMNTPIVQGAYRLDLVGNDLSPKEDVGYVNLSFLRLVGSSTDGVTLCIDGPFNREDIRKVTSEICQSVGKLCREFIVPVEIKFKVTKEEL